MKVRRIKMTHKFTQTLRVFFQLNRKLHELVCLCECIYNSVCVCVRSDSMTVVCVWLRARAQVRECVTFSKCLNNKQQTGTHDGVFVCVREGGKRGETTGPRHPPADVCGSV